MTNIIELWTVGTLLGLNVFLNIYGMWRHFKIWNYLYDAERLLSNHLKRNGEYMTEDTEEVIKKAVSILNKEIKNDK